MKEPVSLPPVNIKAINWGLLRKHGGRGWQFRETILEPFEGDYKTAAAAINGRQNRLKRKLHEKAKDEQKAL